MMLFGEKYGDEVRVVEIPGFSTRALRRHARALDGRDRAVRDPLRELGRRRRAADRGGHVRRGVCAPARPRARGGRAARRARARATRAEEGAARPAPRTSSTSATRTGASRVIEVKESADAAARPLRPDQAAEEGRRRARSARAIDGRVQLVLNIDKGARRARARRVAGDPRDRRSSSSGGGGGRADFAEAGGREPEKLGDALDAGAGAARRSAFVKVLALDYGSARTGVAVSDPTGTIARPLGVVEQAATDAGLARLRELIADGGARARRRRPAADPARRARRAGAGDRALRRALRAARSTCPVDLFDERFTSVARRRRRRPRRRSSALELSRVVARTLALAAAASGAACSVAGCGGDSAKPKPTVPAGPKVLHIVFPEGFTRKEMARADRRRPQRSRRRSGT